MRKRSADCECPPDPTSPHSYFEYLSTLPESQRAVSLRSQAEIDKYTGGEASNDEVVYDPIADAARSSIAAFRSHRGLSADVDAEVGLIPVGSVNPSLATPGRSFKIDDEICLIYKPADKKGVTPDGISVYVKRGQYNTTAAPHTQGTRVDLSDNNLHFTKQVRIPVLGVPENNYFFALDFNYDKSYSKYRLGGYKTFQHADRGTKESIWFETQVSNLGKDGQGLHPDFVKGRDIGTICARSYNTSQPSAPNSNVTGCEPVEPQQGRFVIKPNTWNRMFWFIEIRSNGFEYISLWAADKARGVTQLFDRRTFNLRPKDAGGVPTLQNFWLELNTSRDVYRGFLDPMILWMRNYNCLEGIDNPTPLLLTDGLPEGPAEIEPVEIPELPDTGNTDNYDWIEQD